MTPEAEKRVKNTPRYLLVGVLTVAPLWVTWLVFNFIFTRLSRIGEPWVVGMARAMRRDWPTVSELLLQPTFQSALAVAITLIILYLIGWVATRVIGQRIIHWLESLVQNIPMVAAIYGGTKRFLAVIKEKPGNVQRVVLIRFPSPDMRAVGLVTRVIRDADSGEELAVVYVPTSPNPTSGYIEIVPVSEVISTNWTIDEAMSFVVTGGANSPDVVRFGKHIAFEDAMAAESRPIDPGPTPWKQP